MDGWAENNNRLPPHVGAVLKKKSLETPHAS